MKLEIATNHDLSKIMNFYHEVFLYTPDLYEIVKWEEGYHPNEKEVKEMIDHFQFYLFQDDALIGVFGLTNQGEDYYDLPFTKQLDFDQVGVIHILAIHPLLTSKGYGNQMVQQIIQLAKRKKLQALRLDVIHSNLKAAHLYQKNGFQYVCSKEISLGDIGLEQFDYYELIL